MAAAVEAVNDSLKEGNALGTLAALLAPALGLTDVDPAESGAQHYFATLAGILHSQDGRPLTLEQIQAGVNGANEAAAAKARRAFTTGVGGVS